MRILMNRDSEFPLHKRFAHLRVSDNIKDKVVREQINDLGSRLCEN
jgi:hypothetical protein